MMRNASLLTKALIGLLAFGPLAMAQEDPAKPETPAQPEAPAEPETKKEKRQQRQFNRFQRGMIQVDRLKEELGLTTDQAEKLEGINGQIREQMQSIRKQFQEGNFDPSTMRESFQAARKKVEDQVKTILTPEQAEKWAKIREERGQRMRQGWGNQRRNREQLGERLKDQAVKALALSDEAKAVVGPLLETVFSTRQMIMSEQERRRDELRKKVRETTDPDALQKLLKEFRESNKADREQLKAAQEQLREVLTLEQEAQLVSLNVLD